MKETDIPGIIERDGWMMAALHAAASLGLPDWWIGAGFVRNKIWDLLSGKDARPSGDIDLVYFDPSDSSEAAEDRAVAALEKRFPTGEWSVKNLARMHLVNGDAPYSSAIDGIAHWPETATAVAVRLGKDSRVVFRAAHGADDLLGMIIRSTPGKSRTYRARLAAKRWSERWPELRICDAG